MGESCHGGKRSNQRLTVLFFFFAKDSSDKIPALLMNKFEKPRRFRNLKRLPYQYKFSTKAWMTGVISFCISAYIPYAWHLSAVEIQCFLCITREYFQKNIRREIFLKQPLAYILTGTRLLTTLWNITSSPFGKHFIKCLGLKGGTRDNFCAKWPCMTKETPPNNLCSSAFFWCLYVTIWALSIACPYSACSQVNT